MTSEPGSFARHTVEVRQPQIIAQLLETGCFPEHIRRSLTALRDEIRAGLITPLSETAAEAFFWNPLVAARRGSTCRG